MAPVPLPAASRPNPYADRSPGSTTVLKLCLQLLVCVVIVLRALALFDQLRRAWIADSLAAEFRRELRRRGLLIPALSPRRS